MSTVTSEETEQLALALERNDGTPDDRRMFLRALLRVIEGNLRGVAALVARIGKAV